MYTSTLWKANAVSNNAFKTCAEKLAITYNNNNNNIRHAWGEYDGMIASNMSSTYSVRPAPEIEMRERARDMRAHSHSRVDKGDRGDIDAHNKQ